MMVLKDAWRAVWPVCASPKLRNICFTPRRAILAAALVAAGCVGTGDVPVQGGSGGDSVSRVIMYRDTVTVEMRDKSLCTGPRTKAGKAWEGTLAGCRHLWPFQLTQPAGAITRLPLQEGAGGAGQLELMPPGKAPQIWSGPRAKASG